MKKTLFLSSILLLSIFVYACSGDDDDLNLPGQNNPPSQADPTFEAFISGAITDTISFKVDGGIMSDYGLIGSYSSVSMGLLLINVIELPNGFSIGIAGNKDNFGVGEFVSTGASGHGGYYDSSQSIAFTGTASTIEITSTELVQNVVQETYNVTGTFEITMEDQSTPPQTILMTGSFSNVSIGVN